MQSLIVIIGAAVTLAFVMVEVMNFHLRVSPLYQSAYGDVIVPFDYNHDE